MCWSVKFQIDLLNNKYDAVKKIEEIIASFKIKPEKKGIKEVPFLKGSIVEGFQTALHCDCDNIIEKNDKNDGGSPKTKILHYPEVFKNIIEHPEVRNIQVSWQWSNNVIISSKKMLTISEFIKQNNSFMLCSNITYKIIKERYY